MSGMRTLSSNWPCRPPTVIAVSLPMTCAATWRTTSGMTGLTLPGMIDEPFCSSGRKISPMPARGPEPMSAMSCAILVSDTATTFSAPDSSTSASRLACASNGSAGGSILSLVCLRELAADLLGELRVRVEPGAGRGAAERDLAHVDERRLDALLAEADLRRVAAELLAEGHGHRVHEVRAPRLDDVLEALGLARERALELLERGQQLVGRTIERREVHGAGEHVVGGLAHVDVVVGVHAVAGQRGEDLVGVHVRRGARAGLEDVDRELRVVVAGGHLVARARDRVGELGVELAQVGVRPGRGALDAPEPVDDRGGDRLAGDGEVVDGLLRLAAVERLSRSHGRDPSHRRRQAPSRPRPGRRRR